MSEAARPYRKNQSGDYSLTSLIPEREIATKHVSPGAQLSRAKGQPLVNHFVHVGVQAAPRRCEEQRGDREVQRVVEATIDLVLQFVEIAHKLAVRLQLAVHCKAEAQLRESVQRKALEQILELELCGVSRKKGQK